MSDTEMIIVIVVMLYLPIQIILLCLFIRMSCDIHQLKIKWVNQVKFTDDEQKFNPILDKDRLLK